VTRSARNSYAGSTVLPWSLTVVVAIGTVVISIGTSIATVNMPGDSPQLKDAANVAALVFCLLSLVGGTIVSYAAHGSAPRRRTIAWAAFGTAALGTVVTTILLTLATV
jgi:hypothetical protein